MSIKVVVYDGACSDIRCTNTINYHSNHIWVHLSTKSSCIFRSSRHDKCVTNKLWNQRLRFLFFTVSYCPRLTHSLGYFLSFLHARCRVSFAVYHRPRCNDDVSIYFVKVFEFPTNLWSWRMGSMNLVIILNSRSVIKRRGMNFSNRFIVDIV